MVVELTGPSFLQASSTALYCWWTWTLDAAGLNGGAAHPAIINTVDQC